MHMHTWQPFVDAGLFPNFWNCSLEVSGWEDFLELYNKGDFKVTSGGLGPSRVHHVYLTWVCLKGTIPWPSRYVHCVCTLFMSYVGLPDGNHSLAGIVCFAD
jgi:hypothetical protein